MTASYTIGGVTGPARSVSVSITIAALPEALSATLNDFTPAINQTLRCTASGGTGSYSYQWQRRVHALLGWQNISGATSSSYNVGTLNGGQRIRCRVRSGSETAYATATSDVPNNPALSASLSDYTPHVGDTIHCTASGGTGSYSYQWQFRSPLTSNVWTNSVGQTSSSVGVFAIGITAQLRCCVRSGSTTVYSPGHRSNPSMRRKQHELCYTKRVD